MIAIKGMELPKGCKHCQFLNNIMFGNGMDYSYVCNLGATQIPMPYIRQMEERASDCPLVEIVTCKDCKHWHDDGIMTTCDKNIGNGFPPDHFCKDGERGE